MCGLVAIFGYGDNAAAVDKAELLRIRERMSTRGPDGSGLWISENGRVGLAHRRLAIIDLSPSGAQPMSNAEGTLRIVFNGEIYNYRELRSSLERTGERFVSSSDTEVLLHLYRKHGKDMVRHLRGMYAFALWDEQKRGLFLARDPFGIKPLYYADSGETIRVASQVKALLTSDAVNTSPEPAGRVGFFLWGHVPEPYTYYRGIRAVPAGSSLWISSAGKSGGRFFDLTKELADGSARGHLAGRDEVCRELRAALLDSVRHHLIADVPVGVFLSSGLDSTTLTALVREVTTSPVQTITLGFNEFLGTQKDEVALAEFVADSYHTDHKTRWISKDDFADEYEHLLEVMDQPTIDGVNSYFISQAAAKTGHKVTISGLGGDELFGSYPSFQDIPRSVRAFHPFHMLPLLGKGFRFVSAPILKHFTSPKFSGLLEYGGSYGGAYLLRRGLFMPWELPGILDSDMVREGWNELQTLPCLNDTTKSIENTHLKVSALEMTWYMRNQLLRDTDWASMAHSLEIRLPFVDVELVRSLAPLFASNHAPTKLDMAMTPANGLPKDILYRAKRGFVVPIQEWLLQINGASPQMRGMRGWATLVNEAALSATAQPLAVG
jgi:asparagine synthase (glutamine-hydrolysing)